MRHFISAVAAPVDPRLNASAQSETASFCPPLVFRLCRTTWFFFLFCASFFFSIEWRWSGWRNGASNVKARESLSWADGFVYRVNQGCTNPWLPLTFTGGPFPINLQGPPPLEAWLRPPPSPPNKLIHVSDKSGSPLSPPDWGTQKKGDRLDKGLQPSPAAYS